MEYAVVQAEDTPPTLDQCKAAFAQVREAPVRKVDAGAIMRDCFGVVCDRLSREHAEEVARVLANVGYATRVVRRADLMDLPPAVSVRRLDPLAGGLTIYDALDRPTTVPWDAVLLIAAGTVAGVEHRRELEVLASANMEGMNVTYMSSTEIPIQSMRLKLILTEHPLRVRVDPERMIYTYLGDRMHRNAMVNFVRLVADIARRATQAMLTRGAVSVADDRPGEMIYPSAKAFDEELVWQLWRMGN